MPWLTLITKAHKELDLRDFFEHLDSSFGIKDVYFPIRREKQQTGQVVFKATLPRFLFVNIKDECLLSDFDNFGYFTEDQERACRLFYRKNTEGVTKLKEMLKSATVAENDFYQFRTFNDRLLDIDDEVKVIDNTYGELVMDKDTVNVIDGPLMGFYGVVKQVKEKKKKDHKLIVRIGDLCVQISSIRAYQHILVHEPKRGDKIEQAKTWQHIDHLKGLIQAQGHPDDADEILKSLILHTRGKDRAEAIEFLEKTENPGLAFEREFMKSLDNFSDVAFTNIIRTFPTDVSTLKKYLDDVIPSEGLRPFLTPTSGVSLIGGKPFALLQHKDFLELIARVNIKPFYTKRIKGDVRLEGNFAYFAHIGMHKEYDGRTLIQVNWGEFAKRLLMMTDVEIKAFMDSNLACQEFPTLCRLLETLRNTNINKYFLRLEQSGFCFEIDKAECDDDYVAIVNHPVIQDLITAAVEVFQTCRFAEWRHLLKRNVLLHNIS